MLSRLGITGTCSLLGGLSALLTIIPFLLIWKGEAIRARSRFCNTLKNRDKTSDISHMSRHPVEHLVA